MRNNRRRCPMDRTRMKRCAVLRYLAVFLIAAVSVFSLFAAWNGKALAQAVEIVVDLSRGVLEVTANITDGEILSIEMMGPGSKLVVDEDVASSSFTWAPGPGDPDGLYRYEIQVVDKTTGDMIARKAGMFTVRDGEIKAPEESVRTG
ncbi:MAG: hypothetical protein MZV65_00245 [Chromatiales bacterium]|nr:hypothetical protein [Chromatiales bacterium]